MRIMKFELVIVLGLVLVAFYNSSCNPTTDKKSKEKVSEAIADKDLTKYGIANNPENILGGLEVGDTAPDFSMKDQDGNEVKLSSKLSEGPVLMVFLRAEWCSFCRKHLQAFQERIQDIQQSGKAQVLAVSPQLPEYMIDFHKKNSLNYPILYDETHSVMKDYKVFFHVTDKYNNYIKEAKGNSIEAFNGDDDPVMPVPATYLIGADGRIKYVHYDANYKKRSAVEDILQIL